MINRTFSRQFKPFSRTSLLLLVALHITLGILIIDYDLAARLFGIVPFLVISILVINNKNKNEEAFLGSIYIAGAEIVWRMTEGYITYEFAKYAITIILILGILVEPGRRNWDKRILIYAFSFIPATLAAAFLLPPAERIEQIASILSGPICLIAAVLYFSRRRITLPVFIQGLQLFSFVLITILVILILKNPDLEEIQYRAQSNFATSGGFGPNQVSTILGVGIFCTVVMIWLKKRIIGFLFLDLAFLGLLIFRGLLTFSRGGMLGAAVAITFFFLIIAFNRKRSTSQFARFAVLAVIGAVLLTFIWIRLEDITQGQIVNRYTGKDSLGRPRQNVYSGRTVILENELNTFKTYPLFGSGIAYSKFIRRNELDLFVNTHNELTRTLAEQGLFGAIGILSLLTICSYRYRFRSYFSKALLAGFFSLYFVTLFHSAMRISVVSLLFGLAIMFVSNKPSVRKQKKNMLTHLYPSG